MIGIIWTGVTIGNEIIKMIENIPNNIFIKNTHSKKIYVAIRVKTDGFWKIRYWFEIPPGQVSLIFSGQLESRSVYCHASTKKDKIMWGKGDFEEIIDGKLRKFSKFGTQDLKERFEAGNLIKNRLTITYSYNK